MVPGEGFVGLKEADFEPSSPMRHATEFCSILDMQLDGKKILLVYTDQRVTYVSVKVALISVFLKCNLDFLCAARTALCHSWRNPVEKICPQSILVFNA